MNNTINDNIENVNPLLYYFGLVSYLLFFLNVEISWSYPGAPFKYLCFLFLSAHLIQVIKLYDPKELILLLLVSILVIIVGINAEQLAPLFLSLELIVGAKGIEFKDILKLHFGVSVAICLFSIVGSSLGIIENVIVDLSNEVDLLSDSTKRYSYGYVWPTGCAIHISYICLSYWILKDSRLGIKEVLVFILAIFFIIFYPQARQASIIIFTILIITLYLTYKRNRQQVPKRFTLIFLISSPIILTILCLYMTIAYDNFDYTWMFFNILLTGRLSLGQEAIDEYGFTFLGQYIEMIGGDANTKDYNYVDCSFVQTPLIWGVLLFIILLLVYEFIGFQAYKRKNYTLLFAIFLAAISSVTSQYFFQIKFCPLLLAFFASHSLTEEKENYVEEGIIKEANS